MDPDPYPYTIQSLISLAKGIFSKMYKFNGEEKAAAARGISRLGMHRDDKHLVVRVVGGLHPMYFDFQKNSAEEDSNAHFSRHPSATICEHMDNCTADLLDAATALDRIDGGITFLMRCPGHYIPEDAKVEDLTISGYVMPVALNAGGSSASKTSRDIFQKFGEEMVLHHMHAFRQRCQAEGTHCPTMEGLEPEPSSEGPRDLPNPVTPGSAFIECRLYKKEAFSMSEDVSGRRQSLTPDPLKSTTPMLDTPQRPASAAAIMATSHSHSVKEPSSTGETRHVVQSTYTMHFASGAHLHFDTKTEGRVPGVKAFPDVADGGELHEKAQTGLVVDKPIAKYDTYRIVISALFCMTLAILLGLCYY